jgi:uncharacterized lipoprotein YajG
MKKLALALAVLFLTGCAALNHIEQPAPEQAGNWVESDYLTKGLPDTGNNQR